jgi:hypothetical protein
MNAMRALQHVPNVATALTQPLLACIKSAADMPHLTCPLGLMHVRCSCPCSQAIGSVVTAVVAPGPIQDKPKQIAEAVQGAISDATQVSLSCRFAVC